MSENRRRPHPIDDMKAAARVLRSTKPAHDIADALAMSASVLEPAEADLRVVAPEEIPPLVADRKIPEDDRAPAVGSPTPDEIARHKKHRGY